MHEIAAALEDRITLETIQSMVAVMKKHLPQPPTTFIVCAVEKDARAFTEYMGADYAPVQGEQVVGDYLVITKEGTCK